MEASPQSHMEWNASVSMPQPTLNDLIFEQHVPHMNHLNVSNPPLLIFILGSFCMGKTTVTKKLEERLKAVRICGDEIRNLFKQNKFFEHNTNDYIKFCVSKLKGVSPNRLIILDKSVGTDFYAKLKKLSPTYLIRLVVSDEVILKRIHTRNHEIHDTEFYLTKLEKSKKNYERNKKELSFDFVLDNNGDNFQIPEALINSIRPRMLFNKINHH